MTRKLLVRQGGGTASEVDFLDLGTPRKGAPFFDADTPLWQVGQRFANGESAMGYFKIGDPTALLSTTGFRLRPKAEVRYTEDASGDELTLGWMRVSANDASRRAPYTGGDQVEHDPQLMDCNLDLRGIPWRDGWDRPAETDQERLEALEAAKLNGASSTAPIHRVTTDITIAGVSSGHLCDFSSDTDLEANDYPAGTEVAEIIADIAEQSGKVFGVVLHHSGGSTHKCLLYIDQDDLTTYTTDVRISDQLADHAPDADPPTFEPHWLMGAGREQNMEDVASGVISIYGGLDDEPRTVFVETGDDDDEWETWVTVYNDDKANQHLAQATRRANWILSDRRGPYQTHKVSILVSAEQAHLVEAGMAIETKSVVMEPGPNRHAWVWRRVAEKTIEPVPDGRYWLHLHLERPKHTHGAGGGAGQPGSTTPKPTPECVPEGGDVVDCSWDASGGDDAMWPGGWIDCPGVGSAFDAAQPGFCPYKFVGSGGSGNLIGGDCDLTPGDTYNFTVDMGTNSKFAFYEIFLDHNGSGPNHVSIDWAQPFAATPILMTMGGTFTIPADATVATIQFGSTFGGWHYNATEISHASVPGDEDEEFCVPAGTGGTATTFARSDDSRFDADDQHLTSRLTQRVTNNSGAALAVGDVVVPDITSDDPAVTTTTTAATTEAMVGVITTGGADGEEVIVEWQGVVLIPVNPGAGTPAVGDYVYTSTTAGVASFDATRTAGAVGRVIAVNVDDATVYVLWWGVPDSGSGGGGSETPFDHGSMGSTETVDLADGSWHRGTLTADCTITVQGFTVDEGATLLVGVTQDGTGGWAIVWDADVEFSGDDQPSQSPGDVTWYMLWSDEGNSTVYAAKVGGGGGTTLTIEEEGTPLATFADTLDFVGAGVTASGAGAEKTITIPGTPTGSAGGDLAGTYPNPTVVDDSHLHTSATAPGTGGGSNFLLIGDEHSTPLIFDDILQNEAGDDLLYSDA